MSHAVRRISLALITIASLQVGAGRVPEAHAEGPVCAIACRLGAGACCFYLEGFCFLCLRGVEACTNSCTALVGL